MRRRALLVFAGILVQTGCGDNELGPDKVRPNQAPETVLSSGPPDSTDETNYRVQLFWSGTDRDGTVNHYDFIMVDHPPIRDHIDGDPSDGDPTRVIVAVPAVDDPRWVGTSGTDSVFITLADSLLRSNRPGPGETDELVRSTPFRRWHTYYVRAEDNEGMADPTPDDRSFNANNIAPTIALQSPINAGSEFTGPPVIVFNWSGEDPVNETTSIEPVASRHVIINSRVDISRPGNKYVSYPDSLYVLPERFEWSAWKGWEASDGSGRRAVVSGLARVGDFPNSGFYIFAVQGMDEAGAITPVFDWQSNGKNNVALVRVSGGVGPVLTVREIFLGTQTFVGGSQPIRLDIAGGQAINFRWNADARHYGGEIVAYRYGWDIRNPDNDQEWTSWSLNTTKATTQSFNTGSHRFFLQVRDNAESITQAIYELAVHTVTRSRDILWVDDSDFQTDMASEASEDGRWLAVLGQVATANGFRFDPTLDVYDVVENRREPPPIQRIFDYKAVVWNVRAAGSSGLRRAAQFFDPIPQRNQNTAKAFNFLNIYLANGGAMWISGFRPAKELWPDERETGKGGDPVNVVNWDDPIEPHPPGIDSVGTASLLYKMGIEMFDRGSALDIRRNTRQHYCTGFVRCKVAGADSQLTRSSTAVNHSHTVKIATTDVEAFPPAPVTYQTLSAVDHRHTVTLTPADFSALQRGETVSVESSDNALPQPHRHLFEFVDQLGQWGAPVLATSILWPQPPTNGRTNVEIYNMPNALATQRQPLVPLAGISLSVYCYRNELPEAGAFQYPETADNQPAFILAKGAPADPFYSRAFCGVDLYLLERASHESLAHFVLVRHFRLGQSQSPP